MQDLQSQTRKKRVLLVSEFSQLNTGFSVMANDLLRIMHSSGKYEVAELASYVDSNDYRIAGLPWKVYPVVPTDSRDLAIYREHYRTAQFGSHVFDKAVLDFRPDIVFSYRDFWHDEWITRSASRYLFNYVWSACVDSEPPRAEWIGVFSTVDKMASYTDWGLSVLKKYSGRQTRVAETNTMPGVDQKVFKPIEKNKARELLGIKNDINIILTVMRNQPRKLFPDLMKAFSIALEKWKDAGRQDLVSKSYLYLHTSYPDVGFDIGKDIIKYKLSSKVLMTYCCERCGSYFTSFFNGEVCTCNNCGSFTAHPPNTALGLTREQLATVYNTADLYVQLSVAGALEIPIIEAKACGVPTIATDYAAMYELNRLGGSYGGIKVSALREESNAETGQLRAIPDHKDCADKIFGFFTESDSFRRNLSTEAFNTAKQYHDNRDTFNKWDAIFEGLNPLEDNRWEEKQKHINVEDININATFNDEDFVDYIVYNFTPPKSSLRSFAARRELVSTLNTKTKPDKDGHRRVNRMDLVESIKNSANQFNKFEEFRTSILNGMTLDSQMIEVV